MLLVLDESAEGRLLQLAAGQPVSGPIRLDDLTCTLDIDEDLVNVRLAADQGSHPSRSTATPVPCLVASAGTECGIAAMTGARRPDGDAVLFALPDDSEPKLRAYLVGPQYPEPREFEIEIPRLETDVPSRIRGIFDTRVLAATTVAVIGLGSGGGICAVELAKAGASVFELVDFDRLMAHNISRHACGLSDVGRYKTRAVRDLILQHNPAATVRCHEVDVTENTELLDEIVKASNIVIAATDTQLSRYLINEACLEAGTPAVYGGVYERAFAGEVVRVVPGKSACYACVRHNLADTMRSISSQQQFDYTDDSELQPEPGMGMDVAFVALLQAKIALMTLLRNTESSIGDIDTDMIIWTNAARPEDGRLFAQPMTRYSVRVARSEGCPACGEQGPGQEDAEVGPA